MIKSMSIGEILDYTFTMYRKDFKSYWTLVAYGIIPAAIINIFSLILFPVISQDPYAGDFGVFIEPRFLLSTMIFGIAAGAFHTITYGGVIKKASEQIAGRDIDAKDAFLVGVRKFLPVFLGGLVLAVAAFFGFLALIIPGIYLIVSFALFFHAIIIEDEGPFGALGRSRNLVKGFWWRSLGIFIVIGALTAILTYILALPLSPILAYFIFGNPTTYGIINIVVTLPIHIIITPLTAIAYTLYYYDLRVRKENLDLDMMINDITNTEQPME